jgi:hypothetical protein
MRDDELPKHLLSARDTSRDAVAPSQPTGISNLTGAREMATLGAQYMVKFLDHVDGTEIDHDEIVAILETLINDAIETINDAAGHGTVLGTVAYETDYPVEED